ncbi:sensor histidine kinase [Nonomuraea candida]|uniref:sensor histidine kinase n=1 Tax=Nonomuraea candida TaxID=359159 RepID=UPI00146FCC94|nr:histidine kinase [Nonomuraea candida]
MQNVQNVQGVQGGVLAWVRGCPWVVDGAVALGAFLYNFPVATAAELPYLAVALSVGLCLPYVWRRDRPALSFAAIAFTCFVQWLCGVLPMPGNYLLFFGLYNVASRCERRVSVAAAALMVLGVVLGFLRWGPALTAGAGLDLFTNTVVVHTIFIASVWIWGCTIGTRRAYLASLQEHAVRLERERAHQAQLAAAAERARIAREMHDVVSHSLSVIVVQAAGAAHCLRSKPDRAEQALLTIGETGRAALTEMRHMLGVLRNGEAVAHPYAPQPGVAQLGQLVEEARSSGLPVELTVQGVPRELPAGMELAVYRIVQEALTNTRKHAGPGVSWVRVVLRYGNGELEARISDNGRGPILSSGGVPGDEAGGVAGGETGGLFGGAFGGVAGAASGAASGGVGGGGLGGVVDGGSGGGGSGAFGGGGGGFGGVAGGGDSVAGGGFSGGAYGAAGDSAPGMAGGMAGGHGLVGMRERVAAYGGSLRSGARVGGGFEVVAVLPFDAQTGDGFGQPRSVSSSTSPK